MIKVLLSKENAGEKKKLFFLTRVFGLLVILLGCGIWLSSPLPASATTIKAPIINLGLVGHWTFDGKHTNWTSDSTGTITDASGNSNDGTITNASRSLFATDGVIGQAGEFDGTNDVVQIPDSALYDNIPQISVSSWVKFSNLGVNEYVFSKYRNGFGTWALSKNSFNRPAFQVCNTTATCVTAGNDASYTISDDNWHFLVGTYDGATVRVYLDSVLIATTAALTGNVRDRSDPVCISGRTSDGINCNGDGTYLGGGIDDVRIYNRALTQAEITRLYNIGAPSKIGATQSTGSLSSGLVGHWTFDGKHTNWTSDSTGTITDASGNGNTGTMTNVSRSTFPTDGVIGQAGKFDGVDDSVNIGDMTSLEGSPYATWSFWINPNSSEYDDRFLSKSSAWEISIPNSGLGAGTNKIRVIVDGASIPVVYVNNNYGVLIKDKEWQNFVVVYDGTQSTNTTKVKIYKNGVQISGGSVGSVGTIPTILPANSNNALIGGIVDGTIDDVRIYNRALTQAEITRLYNMGRPTTLSATLSPILNNFSNAKVAYSVRKLRSAYAGYAMTVRRSAGGTQDIGFVGKNLDTSALQSFCAADDCFVTTWYDQSGNGKNLTQATESKQPQIVSSGTILTGENGKPRLSFDGNDDDLYNNSIGSIAHPRLISAVINVTAGEYGSYPWTNSVAAGYSWNGSFGTNGFPNFFIGYSGGGNCCSKSFPAGADVIFQGYYNLTNSVSRIDNGSNTTGSMGGGDTITGLIIGGFYNGGTTSHFTTFTMPEFIMWNETMDQNTRDTILKNQNVYYQTY